MIEEATVDAYGESEQIMGLYTMIDENLAVPFETTVLGMPVTVNASTWTQASRSSRSASRSRPAAFRSSISRCRRRRRPAPSGSRRTAAGPAGADHPVRDESRAARTWRSTREDVTGAVISLTAFP